MNKQTAKAFLPLIQALADGKTIQVFHPSRRVYEDAENPDFSYPASEYRIKPEPREWECLICQAGYLIDVNGTIKGNRPTIRVREILD